MPLEIVIVSEFPTVNSVSQIGGHAVGDPNVCATIDDLISAAMVEKMSSLLPSPFLKKAKISVFPILKLPFL